jgi:muconolactone delta-isomerase
MLFFLDFHVEYPESMSQKELFALWAREADAALGAKKAGAVVDLWKCVGDRRVLAVVNVDSHDALDQVLMDLPIMKEHGQFVHVDVIPIRRYEDFAADLASRSA